MGDDRPLAQTFLDDSRVTVEIVGKPSPIGLVKVRIGDRYYVRATVQLDPLNEAARKLLGK